MRWVPDAPRRAWTLGIAGARSGTSRRIERWKSRPRPLAARERRRRSRRRSRQGEDAIGGLLRAVLFCEGASQLGGAHCILFVGKRGDGGRQSILVQLLLGHWRWTDAQPLGETAPHRLIAEEWNHERGL